MNNIDILFCKKVFDFFYNYFNLYMLFFFCFIYKILSTLKKFITILLNIFLTLCI